MAATRKQNKRAKAAAPKVGAKTKQLSSAQEVASAKARLTQERAEREATCGGAVREILADYNCTMVPNMEIVGDRITKHGVIIVAQEDK